MRPGPLAAAFAARAARGQATAKAMVELKKTGFSPNLIIGHFGWGETLFAKDVFPAAKLIVHAEFYYSAVNSDADFDPEFRKPGDIGRAMMIRSKNAAILPALIDADYAVTPTRWQASRFPKELRGKIAVLHEGIDTDKLAPNPQAVFTLKDSGRAFRPGDEVITFVNRNLEPYRGYHIFMRALPRILKERPNAHVVIVGGDSVSYGAPAPKDKTWKEIFLSEVRDRLPMQRVHFTGKIPYPDFIALMQVSAAHVYLTYPFVLSWSMMEAMSAGALVIASDTTPVTEVIKDGETGLLTDFFDVEALAAKVTAALAAQGSHGAIRAAARAAMIERYDLKRRCLPQWLGFLEMVVKGTVEKKPAG